MEQVELHAIEKMARANEERALKALAALESEQKAREVPESGNRRLQADLGSIKAELEAAHDQLSAVQKFKDSLEIERGDRTTTTETFYLLRATQCLARIQ